VSPRLGPDALRSERSTQAEPGTGLTRAEYRPRSATQPHAPAPTHARPVHTPSRSPNDRALPRSTFVSLSPRPTKLRRTAQARGFAPSTPTRRRRPLDPDFLPALGAGQEGPHSPEYRLVRQRFRPLAKTPRLPVCPLPGKGRARPPRLTTPASENRAQETARPHPCRSTRSAWQRRPSPVQPG